jgi:argonaute-like protein implicated in RNA metabolism and viral defense
MIMLKKSVVHSIDAKIMLSISTEHVTPIPSHPLTHSTHHPFFLRPEISPTPILSLASCVFVTLSSFAEESQCVI